MSFIRNSILSFKGSKSEESVNPASIEHSNTVPGSEIFGSPNFSPRDLNIQQNVVSRSSFDSVPSKPVETFRRDGAHAIESKEESSVLKRLEAVKMWSVTTLKCTKQVIEETLGTSVPTCDEKLDLRIQTLKQMQKQYRLLLDTIRHLSANISKTVQSQRELAGQLATLGQQQIELSDTLAHNAETQKFLATNGEKLVCALDAVCNGLSTLVNQTFDDTMLTIRNMNLARIEYDAYRKETDSVRASLSATGGADNLSRSRRMDQALARFTTSEENFFRLKAAVDAKLRLLHENRLRVMQHQLSLLQNATTAYSTGNVALLDQTLKQFNLKLTPHPNNSKSTSTNHTIDRHSRKRFSLRKSTNGTN